MLLFFLSMIPRLPRSTLFPYTTLFRSRVVRAAHQGNGGCGARRGRLLLLRRRQLQCHRWARSAAMALKLARSEEHTSELQSHVNLVCRLLLEKKKKTKTSLPNMNDHI